MNQIEMLSVDSLIINDDECMNKAVIELEEFEQPEELMNNELGEIFTLGEVVFVRFRGFTMNMRPDQLKTAAFYSNRPVGMCYEKVLPSSQRTEQHDLKAWLLDYTNYRFKASSFSKNFSVTCYVLPESTLAVWKNIEDELVAIAQSQFDTNVLSKIEIRSAVVAFQSLKAKQFTIELEVYNEVFI